MAFGSEQNKIIYQQNKETEQIDKSLQDLEQNINRGILDLAERTEDDLTKPVFGSIVSSKAFGKSRHSFN